MSTVQIMGIAIAVVIVIALVVSLLLTRGKGAGRGADAAPPIDVRDTSSFFDEKPRDELEKLAGGRPEPAPVAPVAAPVLAAAPIVLAAAPIVPTDAPDAQPLGADTPAQSGGGPTDEARGAGPADVADAGSVDGRGLWWPGQDAAEEPAGAPDLRWPLAEPAATVVLESAATEDLASPPGTSDPVAAQAEVPAAGDAGEEAAPPAQSGARLVALADIIVTTNRQVVDLDDSDVRRMLRDLMNYEISMAEQYHKLGQDLDAALQLQEALRISDALDLLSHGKLIREMLKALQT
jgi:hypothetical protein